MTIGTAVQGAKKVQNQCVVPCSGQTQWQVLCADPATADNSGSAIVAPMQIARPLQAWMFMGHAGTTVQFCLKYVTGQAVSTAPTIQPFGHDGSAPAQYSGLPQALFDSSSNYSKALTAASTDVQDGNGFSYTNIWEVDVQGNTAVLAAIQVALIGGGAVSGTSNGVAILGRVK